MVEANRQARIQTAPHLRTNRLSLGIRQDNGTEPRSVFSFNVKNYGTTAANKIKFRIHLYAVDTNEENIIRIGRKKVSLEWLRPDATTLIEDNLFIIDKTNCWEYVKSVKALVVDFRLTFVDIYGEIHQKSFCFMGEMYARSDLHLYVGEFDRPEAWVVKALRPKR